MSKPQGKCINPRMDFTKLFEAAEIAKFSPKEREAYEESLKHYRDLNNIVDTAKEEGVLLGMEKGMKKRDFEIAKALKNNDVATEIIMESTGLSREEIEEL